MVTGTERKIVKLFSDPFRSEADQSEKEGKNKPSKKGEQEKSMRDSIPEI